MHDRTGPNSFTPQSSPNEGDTDLVERLMADWARERPDFDTSAMGVVGRIIVLAQRYEAEVNEALKVFGLRYTEFDILATLRRTGEPHTLTPTQLCNVVLLTSGAMTAALDRLEAMALVERITDHRDRRVKAAKLTAKGIQIAEDAAKRRFEIAQQAITHLSGAQRSSLSHLLGHLTLPSEG